MRRTADAIVIGSGIVGTAIGLELARKGLKPLVLDRHAEVGRGATRTSTAIIRSSYGSKLAVGLALEGYRVFDSWAEHVAISKPRAHLAKVGCALVLAASDETRGDALMRMMQSVGASVEGLSGREAQALVPGMRATRTRVLFECSAGYVSSAPLATRDIREAAEASGASFLLDATVNQIRCDAKGRGSRRVIGVTTEAGLQVDAPIVVNAGGAQSAHVNLLADCPLPLTTVPAAQSVIRGELEGGTGELLPVIADLPGGLLVRFDGTSFKLGPLAGPRESKRYLTNSEERPRAPNGYLDEYRRSFQKRYPKLRWRDARVSTGVIDLTVLDGYPIIDKTELNGYYVAVGTGGTWFNRAPTLGWLMSELIAAVESGHDHDADPVRVPLPRSGFGFDIGQLSRNRRPITSIIGLGSLG